MKRFPNLALFLLFCAFAVNAQTDQSVKWQAFPGFDEEFSAEAPENVKMTKFAENRRESPRFYEGYAENTYFFISTGEEFSSNHYKRLAETAAENGAQAVETTIGNFPARKFSFTDDEDFRQTTLAVQGNKRFYFFHTLSETPEANAAERFFSSLSFGDFQAMKKFPKTEPLKPKIKENNQNLPLVTESSPTKNETNTVIRERPPTGNSPLNITYKPAPSYTDLARQFGVVGEIILRVTFLAGGTIGDITPIKKLPFGMTKSAVNTARRMRFEPEWKDGQPISAVRNISFRFTIH